MISNTKLLVCSALQICREDALKKSEEMLESDAVKFDQFLRENETKVNETIKHAEAQAKRRADRQVRTCSHLHVMHDHASSHGT
jgi:hypothetical protein